MKFYVPVISFFLIFTFTTSTSHSQIFKDYKPGKLYLKRGKPIEGQISARDAYLYIKNDDTKKKKIPLRNIEKFEIYRRKDTTTYAYYLDKYEIKKKPEHRRYTLGYLVFDYENIKVYKQGRDDTDKGLIEIGIGYLFLQKKGSSYATSISVVFKDPNKILKKYFARCKELASQIGTTYQFKDLESLQEIVEFYDANCGRKSRTRKKPVKSSN
ncbi:MAG: hypothetical protein CMC70_09555 [Flavobacteriaceae bacterium]|nr:hypothetical protein [Flavobacteriaceae bacterium]